MYVFRRCTCNFYSEIPGFDFLCHGFSCLRHETHKAPLAQYHDSLRRSIISTSDQSEHRLLRTIRCICLCTVSNVDTPCYVLPHIVRPKEETSGNNFTAKTAALSTASLHRVDRDHHIIRSSIHLHNLHKALPFSHNETLSKFSSYTQ